MSYNVLIMYYIWHDTSPSAVLHLLIYCAELTRSMVNKLAVEPPSDFKISRLSNSVLSYI